jgi:cyclic pyranopterin phosphate synthase
MRVRPTPDPDAFRPPADLASALEPGRTLDPRAWATLRAIERYALVHALRHAPDRAYLHDVFDDVFAPASALRGPSSAGAPAAGLRPPSLRPPGAHFPRSSAPPASTAPTELARQTRDPGPMTVSDRPPAVGAIPGAPRLPSEMPASTLPRDPDGPTSLSSHLTAAGEVHMVDVGAKAPTARRAVAAAAVRMRAETIARVAKREVGKGEVLATARLAGIMAAKRTPELVPLCHHVALTRVEVHLDLDVPSRRVLVTAVAEAFDRTGVEMEAMVAASAASLTVYDMLKGIDRDIVIEAVRLLEKSGGRTGAWRREEP